MKKVDSVVTESRLNKVLEKALKKWSIEICETILNGVDQLLKDYSTKKDLKRVEEKVEKLEFGQSDIKRQLTDLKMDTPTMTEFTEVKCRVDKYLPA